MTTTTNPTTTSGGHVELAIGGMTCASCAARVERRLNRIEGVAATVNFATEHAKITYPETVTTTELVAQVQAVGYTAKLIDIPFADKGGGTSGSEGVGDHLRWALRQRLVVSMALAAPVVVMSMIPAAQFRNWQWASLVLAAPVVVWGAAPFHRAAWTNLRHGGATMDTLVSMGVLAGFGWSLYALFIGDAGTAGMHMPFALTAAQGTAHDEIYLEAASGVTVFLLAGRFFEARARHRSGAALGGWCE